MRPMPLNTPRTAGSETRDTFVTVIRFLGRSTLPIARGRISGSRNTRSFAFRSAAASAFEALRSSRAIRS
jgi:hypothetical protein